MPPPQRSVSASVDVAAPPSAVFDLLADPRRHGEIDGSGTVGAAVGGPQRLQLGDRFGMDMRAPVGNVPYRMQNTVVEYEPDRRIAWRHWGRHVWRWELEPIEEGTRVTETFDWGPSLAPRALELLGYPRRNAAAIHATLRRLQERFGAVQR